MYGAMHLRPLRRLPRRPRQSLRERRRHHRLPSRRLRPRTDQPAGPAGDAGAGRRVAARCGLRADHLRHHRAHAVRQCQAEAGRDHSRPRRRLRHRLGAIQLAKAIGCTVITTVGDDDKVEKAKALGADHVINYKTDRFEGVVRKITKKKGVDVVFEHVGGEGFDGSLFCLKRGGRLVTCGSTSGRSSPST